MNTRIVNMILIAAAVLVGLLIAPLQVASQGRGGRGTESAEDAPPAPRLPDGRPDLSGVWNGGGGIGRLAPGEEIVMTPWAQEIFDDRNDPAGNAANEDPNLHCLPSGVPRMSPYPWRMVQTPTHGMETHIFMLFEGNIHSYRQIFMDGRPHPEDPDPTWYGHSVGRWEGDTLAVDTVGYNDQFWFDFPGHPHSVELHTIERFTRTDMNTLQWDVTIEDPVAYEKPFTATSRARLMPRGEILEYICQENNTSIGRMRGRARSPGDTTP
jgi:hypothetical protein